MYIKTVSLKSFRNYTAAEIPLSRGINVFHGGNGSGKTNILEAIYWLSMGKSFRSSEDSVLVRHNESFASVSLVAAFHGGIEKEFLIEYDSATRKKTIKCNGTRLKRNFEVIGQVPVVLFSPENIMMIKGDPGLRRSFIDDLLVQQQPHYYELYSRYLKEVSHRNYILKKIREGTAVKANLDAWNELVAEKGAQVILARVKAVAELNAALKGNLKSNSFAVTLSYFSKNFTEYDREKITRGFKEFFAANYPEETARGTTLCGPHRDDIEIFYDSLPAKKFASEGQQRTSAILIKLAEASCLCATLGTEPVILLDDFSSELDRSNREFISRTFSGFNQIIITTTSMENTGSIKTDAVFGVNSGTITK